MKPAVITDIKKYYPANAIYELRKVKTALACVQSGAPRLSELKKQVGEDKVLTLIEIWILDTNEFFNVNNKMSPVQIHQTALMLMQDFYYFNIADINYLFTQAKKGRYGELYGSIDGMKIFSWFEKHDIERSEVGYFNKLQEHDIEMQNEKNAKSLRKNRIGKKDE